jgi:phage-related protein
MRTRRTPDEKPLHWVGSSKGDLLDMPEEVRREVGFALGVAQHGGKHPRAKPWKGQGPGVLEIVSNFDGDTFRSVYTVKFAKAMYVLHCFQKKSPSGIRTARTDIDLVRDRLKAACTDYERLYGKAKD